MRKESFFLLFSIVITIAVVFKANAQYQPAPVHKSTKTVVIQGKTYYLHTIKPKQTLHSICKVYEVSLQEIADANPGTSLDVIKPEQVIRIPSKDIPQIEQKTYKNLTENDFIYHKIEPQQTVYYLSKKYNVPKEAIYHYNPGTDKVIQTGQIIRIPKSDITYSLYRPHHSVADSGNYIVKKGDTLYSLARLYSVSIAELIRLNPDLRWGLKAGMQLNIPGLSDLYAKTDSTVIIEESIIRQLSEKQCDSIFNLSSNQAIKVALLLPFHISEINKLNSLANDSLKKYHVDNKYATLGNSFIEYYQGLLLALDSLKEKGQNITLFTYDTKADTNVVKKIIKEFDVIKPNIIIGPVYENLIIKVSEYAILQETPLILPVTRNNSDFISHNPYAITMLPDLYTELDLCANYISQLNNQNIILLHNQDTSRMKSIDYFRNKLFEMSGIEPNTKPSDFHEIKIDNKLSLTLAKTLKKDKDNMVIIFTSNEPMVSDIVSQLNFKKRNYPVQILGLPKWLQYSNLRIEQLHNLNAIIYSPFYIDYSKKQTSIFIKNARSTLGYEPYKKVSGSNGFNFTYLGYETGLLFINGYNKYESSFLSCICNIKDVLPQNNYNFVLNPDGNFTNHSINFVRFNENYTVERIDFIPQQVKPNKKSAVTEEKEDYSSDINF